MLVIISGPSGSGKGTVVGKIDREDCAHSISVTTREKRPGEEHGVHYFFTTKEDFIERRQRGEFLEHAEFVGNLYGTPKDYVEGKIAEGKAVILEIDVVGALQIKEKFEDCILIFLIPPTMADLKKRLQGRSTEDEATINRRVKRANFEIEYFEKYDYLVINDEVEETVSKIHTIIASEYLKPSRNQNFIHAIRNEIKGDEV